MHNAELKLEEFYTLQQYPAGPIVATHTNIQLYHVWTRNVILFYISYNSYFTSQENDYPSWILLDLSSLNTED